MTKETVAAAILFASFVLCAPIRSHGQNKPLKVGVISGLSGIAAKWNRYQNMGIQLAQAEFDSNGQAVELVIEDSQTQGAKVISAFHKLVGFDHVNAIIANDFGFVVAPLLPLIQQRKTLLYALSLPQDNYCNQGGGYFFSGTSQFIYSKEAFDRFFILHPEIKKIAFVTFDDPEWGRTYLKIWTEIAQERKIQIVDSVATNEFAPDFTPLVAKFIQKGAEAIFVAHEPESFFKARQRLQYKGLLVLANNVLEMLADHPRRDELEGTYMVDPEISDDFRQKFYARYKLQPILEAYAGYEALRAIVTAFNRDSKSPHLALKSVAYEGVAGRIDFTGKSCAGNRATWSLYRFEDGRQVKQ